MTASEDYLLDTQRDRRLGLSEAILCSGKSPVQIAAIIDHAQARGLSLLLTRFDEARFAELPPHQRDALDYDPLSRTGVWGSAHPLAGETQVAVVTAGTSDLPVAREAARTLAFEGFASEEIVDVGVAGLWRLLRRVEDLQRYPVVIVAAGMDAALPSVIGGLVGGLVIAVPTSVGYGVAAKGQTALNAILASCAPGIVTVNIDNGYGAACAAIRALGGRPAKGGDTRYGAS